jgi:SAM-dependent methyltransferase
MRIPDVFTQGEAYDRLMGRWSRQLAQRFVMFTGVQDGQVVLDVGCGTGALAMTIAAARPHAEVTGVDASAALVRAANACAGNGVRFLVGDAQDLRWPDASFDLTLSLLVVNFIPDRDRALREMIRVTRPGGTIAAAVWDYGAGMLMLRTFWDEALALTPAIADRDERCMPLCRPGELAAFWRDRGLVDVEERPLTISQRFDGFEDYWMPFQSGQGPAGAYASSLSMADRARLASKLRARLLPQGDAPFELQALAWAVKGRRDPSSI